MKSTPMLMSGPLVIPTLADLKTHSCRPVTKYVRCPFGTIGDHVWIQEKWKIEAWTGEDDDPMLVRYAADNVTAWREVTSGDGSKTPEREADKFLRPRWTPSMNMPEWAHRIDLEVTDVSVFRVQDITPATILREGVWSGPANPTDGVLFARWQQVWTDIYGAESWAANPWVWGVGFKRVTL